MWIRINPISTVILTWVKLWQYAIIIENAGAAGIHVTIGLRTYKIGPVYISQTVPNVLVVFVFPYRAQILTKIISDIFTLFKVMFLKKSRIWCVLCIHQLDTATATPTATTNITTNTNTITNTNKNNDDNNDNNTSSNIILIMLKIMIKIMIVIMIMMMMMMITSNASQFRTGISLAWRGAGDKSDPAMTPFCWRIMRRMISLWWWWP